jgi:hypothetical protein
MSMPGCVAANLLFRPAQGELAGGGGKMLRLWNQK